MADLVIDAPLAPAFLKQFPDIIEAARAEATAANAAAEKLEATLQESAKGAEVIRKETQTLLAAFLSGGSAAQLAEGIISKIEKTENNLASIVETIVDEGMRGDVANHAKIGAALVELVELKALYAAALAS